MLNIDVELNMKPNDNALKKTELENGENENFNHSCAQVFVRSLSVKSTDSEEQHAIDLVLPGVVSKGMEQGQKECVEQELITGEHVSQQTDTKNYADCLETANNGNCSLAEENLVNNASFLKSTTEIASKLLQTPTNNTAEFYCMANEHISLDPRSKQLVNKKCQELSSEYYQESGVHPILMDSIKEKLKNLIEYSNKGIRKYNCSSEKAENRDELTLDHMSDVSQNENSSPMTYQKADVSQEENSPLTTDLPDELPHEEIQRIVVQIIWKIFINMYIRCMLEVLKSYDLVPANEYGCYKDLALNGLIIDFRPWLEFGDVKKLRTDILSKIPVCIKKGIIVFPEWLRVTWVGPIRFQTTVVLGNGGIGSVYSGELTNGVLSLKIAAKIIPRLKWRNEEAEALLHLQEWSLSPNLYGVVVKGDHVSLLMELIHGVTLSAWIPRDVLCVVELFRKLLHIVSILHKKGIFHQDLKVSNIMLRDQNDPKSVVIIDFGSVIMFDSNLNPLRPITHAFAPPERHMTNRSLQRPIDERLKRLLIAWDSWSLGIILFNLLTRKTFRLTWDVTQSNLDKTRAKIMNCIEKQISVTLGHGDVPDYIASVIKSLLEPDHRRRMTPEAALEMFASRKYEGYRYN